MEGFAGISIAGPEAQLAKDPFGFGLLLFRCFSWIGIFSEEFADCPSPKA